MRVTLKLDKRAIEMLGSRDSWWKVGRKQKHTAREGQIHRRGDGDNRLCPLGWLVHYA